ncbi:MAG: hypothetical protein KGZ39_08030 [Simkania sp.]|nr:hypothetical protein [Simkania sp.]
MSVNMSGPGDVIFPIKHRAESYSTDPENLVKRAKIGEILTFEPKEIASSEVVNEGVSDHGPKIDPLEQWCRRLKGKQQLFFCPLSLKECSGEKWLYMWGIWEYKATQRCVVGYFTQFKKEGSWDTIKTTSSVQFFENTVRPFIARCESFKSRYDKTREALYKGYVSLRTFYEMKKQPFGEEDIEELKGLFLQQRNLIRSVRRNLLSDFEEVSAGIEKLGSKYASMKSMQRQLENEQVEDVLFIDLLGDHHQVISKRVPEFKLVEQAWVQYRQFIVSSMEDLHAYLQKSLTATSQIQAFYLEGEQIVKSFKA